MTTSLKHAREESPSEGANKRFRPEVLTFKNRNGEVQPTHTWFTDDKMIALRTPPRSDPETHETIFLACRGILCRESLVFRDILSIPPPENPKEGDTYEGHPLITVQDDPQNLQDFLEALHDWRSYSDSGKSNSILSVVALLRLGTKYQIAFLRRKMLKKLAKYLPHKYQQCVAVGSDLRPTTRQERLIVLAALEEVDYPLLLPAATYMCTIKRTISMISSALIRDFPPQDKGVWFFSEQSRTRVLRMKGAKGSWFCRNMLSALGPRSPVCGSPTDCSAVLSHWPHWFAEDGRDSLLIDNNPCCFTPKHYLLTGNSAGGHKGFCADCIEYSRPLLIKRFEATWKELPLAIGLGTWDELRAQSKMDPGDEDEQDDSEEEEGSTTEEACYIFSLALIARS